MDKINGKPSPLPSSPNQRWENGAFWLLRGFILDLGGGGGGWGFAVPFYFVQDCSITTQPWGKYAIILSVPLYDKSVVMFGDQNCEI